MVPVTFTMADVTNLFGSSTDFKAALFYVEQTVTVHIVLFCVWTQMSLLVSCSFAFQYLLVFCARSRPANEREREQKHIKKKAGEFHDQSP